jgi:hypothetical protein
MSGGGKFWLGLAIFVTLCSVLSDGLGPLLSLVWCLGGHLFWAVLIALGITLLVKSGRK